MVFLLHQEPIHPSPERGSRNHLSRYRNRDPIHAYPNIIFGFFMHTMHPNVQVRPRKKYLRLLITPISSVQVFPTVYVTFFTTSLSLYPHILKTP